MPTLLRAGTRPSTEHSKRRVGRRSGVPSTGRSRCTNRPDLNSHTGRTLPMAPVARFDPVALLTLWEIRTYIRRSSARGGVVFFALLYVLGSLFLGGMVVLGNIRGGYTISTVWGGAASGGSWNYPGLLIIAPWGVVSLPFFATCAMIVVGIGVGFGMTVAFLLGIGLLRTRGTGRGGTSTAGTVAGLTPAMLSLVTLGACCSTTAAATAGVG